MIDPRPSKERSKSNSSTTGGGIHDDWRSNWIAKSMASAVASRQALTLPVYPACATQAEIGGWGHTRAGGSIRGAEPENLPTRLLPS